MYRNYYRPRRRRGRRFDQAESYELRQAFVEYLFRESRLGSWERQDLDNEYQMFRAERRAAGQKAWNFGSVLRYLYALKPRYIRKWKRGGLIHFAVNCPFSEADSNPYSDNSLSLDFARRLNITSRDISVTCIEDSGSFNHGQMLMKNCQPGLNDILQVEIKNLSSQNIKIEKVDLAYNEVGSEMEIINKESLTNEILIFNQKVLVEIHCTKHEIGLSSNELFISYSKRGAKFNCRRKVQFEVSDNIIDGIRPTKTFSPQEDREDEQRVRRRVIDIGERPVSENRNQLVAKVSLENCEIPSNISSAFHHKMLLDNRDIKELFRADITTVNYAKKFDLLLYVEELQNKKDLKRYNMKNVKINKVGRGRNPMFEIKVPGLAEKRPSVLRGDHIHVSLSDNKSEIYRGYVHTLELNSVLVSFGESFKAQFISGQNYLVEFTLNRFPYQIMHRAISMIKCNEDFISMICDQKRAEYVPDPKTGAKKLVLFNRILESNPEQFKAIERITNNKLLGAPYIVFGPPGTGKTVTIVEAMKQIHKNEPHSHILVCAPSNSACDLLVERLGRSGRIEKREIFRMNASSRKLASIESEFVQSVSNFDASGSVYFPSKEDLMQYRIVACTLITAGRLASAGFPTDHFTDVFIDEAGYAMEPESIVALAGIVSKSSRVILAGDCKQLGPIIHNKIAFTKGLGTSMLERLMSKCAAYMSTEGVYNEACITKLLNNYRSHEVILKTSNKLFYENELRVCADKMLREKFCYWDELPRKGFPIYVHGIQGQDEREENSPSFFNAYEVSAVIRHVKSLLEGKITVKGEDIGIITPYHKQVCKIRQEVEKLKRTNRKARDIKIGTVEEFQGQERLVIIISTVRSTAEYLKHDSIHHLGFVKSPKRFNVAVTRAKSLLIIVGNPKLLSLDKHWRSLLKYCVDNKAYTGFKFEFEDDDEEEDDSEDEDNAYHEVETPAQYLQEN